MDTKTWIQANPVQLLLSNDQMSVWNDFLRLQKIKVNFEKKITKARHSSNTQDSSTYQL